MTACHHLFTDAAPPRRTSLANNSYVNVITQRPTPFITPPLPLPAGQAHTHTRDYLNAVKPPIEGPGFYQKNVNLPYQLHI